ncbi:MAG: type II secretion system minor pseudopilin GspJ, partial [Pseudomonadota bacterium]
MSLRRITSYRPSDSGFTLLELLVAMAIFAIISAVSYTGWYNIQQIKVRTEAQAERLDELQRAWYWMSEDFEQALDRPVRDQLGGGQLAFQGSNSGDALASFSRGGWTNPAAEILPNRSSVQRVSYVLEDRKLYREYWYHLDGIESESRRRRL